MRRIDLKRGLFVGRFNPFHLGHLMVVKEILAEENEVIIAIGSTQESHTLKNPFTAGERVWMIHESLKEAEISLDQVFVITIPDLFRNSIWIHHVRSYCPPFTRAYTNNNHTRRLFKEAGIDVKPTGVFNRTDFNGSKIRELMLEGSRWQKMVPKAVIKIIGTIDGIERIRNISKKTD
ncbi:MAG: nicotinamide-nucleotide adenylyltransferase [Candidatus Heimdallarchaeota archaeon]|nr:nicotinamide-nucleotide adenylyltransferase [Candidatus Heimdallarchaeota archaeon]